MHEQLDTKPRRSVMIGGSITHYTHPMIYNARENKWFCVLCAARTSPGQRGFLGKHLVEQCNQKPHNDSGKYLRKKLLQTGKWNGQLHGSYDVSDIPEIPPKPACSDYPTDEQESRWDRVASVLSSAAQLQRVAEGLRREGQAATPARPGGSKHDEEDSD